MRFFVFLLVFTHPAAAQKLLKGIVLDAEKSTPVPKASVFLNNTSIGTTAADDGSFQISLPAGRFELIVSSVGYATHSQAFNTIDIAEFVTVKLNLKAPELEAVIIEPYEKDGWQKWGQWMINNFIGMSSHSRDTRIKNPEVLRFRNSKRSNALTVTATEPLVIENKALGYRITYQLETFRYDFNTRFLLYAGYPFFENLKGSDRKKRQWDQVRNEVYYGSMLQFMRAVYRNRIVEEGFEVRRLRKIPNAEKHRVRTMLQANVRQDVPGGKTSAVSKDSSAYYQHIMSQDDYKDILDTALLTGDSIAFAVNSTVAGMEFPDYLLIMYKHKNLPHQYKQAYPRSGNILSSEIKLTAGEPIQIFENGSYFHPENLVSSGYWAWWEKMSTMLPFNYTPPKR